MKSAKETSRRIGVEVMSEEEKLQLENECLLKYSKAQMIQKYIDELEENVVLSDLWCKSQKKIKEVREYIEKHIAMFKNGDMLVDINIDELLEILDKGDMEKMENDVKQEKLDSIISKQAKLEYKIDFIFEMLQDIRNGLEEQELDKRMIEAKNRKKDADREIKDIELSSHYECERVKEEKQRYNGYFCQVD